ncbi:MerR family transcriptional regulator [Paracoccus jeotgali]|uniref:MerR family transcriptional regulator n=1 Tax=Paracoccus jeotgali TaxID=2065379 RepID=A0A2K9MEU3_9RHOB|nr:MerR family transcriptional regulator [Paracoccus jeotgali]AUM74168.1 MerR family transcriptional regulator [Paracoccus jeotgali]
MAKAAAAFRSIGEVSQLVGVAPHVLRYWETQFPLLSPVKRRDGRRYYRPDDVRLAAGLCEILREEGMSIRGAKQQMSADKGAAIRARGAARLGGDFAVEAPEQAREGAEDMVKVSADPVRPSKPAEPVASEPARRRKEADTQPLPLFPDATPAPQASPCLDWLHRLRQLRQELSGFAPTASCRHGLAAIHQRLCQARASLAA